MNIEVRCDYKYHHVKLYHENITLDLGTMDDTERDDLAKNLIEAVWALGPNSSDECGAWLASMLRECGIELPEVEQ